MTHFPLPYGSVPLVGGPALERAYDELAWVAALQGIVNRDRPRLYLLGVTHPGSVDLDRFWRERMAEAGWSVARQEPTVVQSVQELGEIFGHRTRGLVVWDPAVPATANVAATVAGVEDLLPVAYRSDPASLYQELRRLGWGVGVWLVQPDGSPLFTRRGTIPGTALPSTGSAKNDAYRWAIAHYLETGRCRPDVMAYVIDAYWLQNPAASFFWNNQLVNHDYYVAERGFFFDLDPWSDEAPVDDPTQKPGTDAATLDALLAAANRRLQGRSMIHVGGFIPWAFKYTDFGRAGGSHAPVPTEWEYARTLSWYNAYMEGDALAYAAIANASFTRHMPLQGRYAQRPAPDAQALASRGLLVGDGAVPPRRYFAFYVGDFDSPAWLYHALPELWNDPARGSVPLSWAFDPNLCQRAAPAMVWTRQTASAQDSFVAGDSGAGYLNPGALAAPRPSGLPSGYATWGAHCRRYYAQWDIAVTGFIIEGFAPAMGSEGLDAYAEFSPGGIVGQKLPSPSLVRGMPTLAMGADIGGSPEQAAATITGLFGGGVATQFAVARGILQTPSWYRQVADLLEQQGIVVLDLITLLALLRFYLQGSGSPSVVPGQTSEG